MSWHYNPLTNISQECSVCIHENRESIELSLVSGEPIWAIAGRNCLSRSALQRHKSKHIPKTLAKAEKAGELTHADKLLGKIIALEDVFQEVLRKARENGDLRICLSAGKELRENFELLSRINGLLEKKANANKSMPIFILPPSPRARTIAESFDPDIDQKVVNIPSKSIN